MLHLTMTFPGGLGAGLLVKRTAFRAVISYTAQQLLITLVSRAVENRDNDVR